MPYFVYILRSSSNQLYIGQTNNLANREKQQLTKSSKAAKFIKDGSRLVLSAYSKKIIRGFIYGEPPFGGISIVYWLAIDPSFQRQGIG